MSLPWFLVLGPLVESEGGLEQPALGGELELEYRGFRLLARAKRGPVGWTGELMIVFSPVELPVQAYCDVPRFHMDPMTALQEALLHGIMRVEKAEVLDL